MKIWLCHCAISEDNASRLIEKENCPEMSSHRLMTLCTSCVTDGDQLVNVISGFYSKFSFESLATNTGHPLVSVVPLPKRADALWAVSLLDVHVDQEQGQDHWRVSALVWRRICWHSSWVALLLWLRAGNILDQNQAGDGGKCQLFGSQHSEPAVGSVRGRPRRCETMRRSFSVCLFPSSYSWP